EARDATFACRVDHNLRAQAIDRVKIALLGYPHPRQRSKVVHLFDVVERFPHSGWIENRASNVLHSFRSACGRANIKNAHAMTLCEDCYQMLSDKAAAAGNERLHYGCWRRCHRRHLIPQALLL